MAFDVRVAFTAVGSVLVLPMFNAEREVASVGHWLWHGEVSALGDACMGSVFVLKALIFYAFSFFSSFPGRIILAHSDSRFGPSKNCSAEHGMAAVFTRSLDVPLH